MPKQALFDRTSTAGSGLLRTLFCVLCIAGLTDLSFLPTLDNGFTNWDDDACVTDNPVVKEFTVRNIAKIFSSAYLANYQPVTMLTYMAEYAFFGLHPAPYHGVSVVLHCINGILVFALVFGLSGSRAAGLIAAGLLFAVHPLRVESVAWIAERKDVLSALFYLLSLLLYLRYKKTGGGNYYGCSLAALFFSLLSKPMAVSQPFVLLLLDYVNHRKIDRKALLEKAPFFAAAAVVAVVTIVIQKNMGPAASDYYSLPLVQRLCVPFYGVVFYLVKTVVPIKLCSFYAFPATLDAGINAMLLTAPLLVAGGLAAVWRYAAWTRQRPPEAEAFFVDPRKVVFCALFFLITVAPVLQIVPVGGAMVAERYTYLPTIGLCFLFAEASVFLLTVTFRDSRPAQGIFWVIIAAAAVMSVFLTRERCRIWNNSVSLWSDVIEKCPSAVAYANMGAAYTILGSYGLAIENYNQAIRLNPRYALAYCNRGVARRATGDCRSAIKDYDQAIRLDPDYAQAYNNRGVAMNASGDQEHAIEDFARAIRLSPGYAQAYNNRGVAYCTKGDYRRATEDYTKALMLNPRYGTAFYNRAQIYRAIGDFGHALGDLHRACDAGIEAACKALAGNQRTDDRSVVFK